MSTSTYTFPPDDPAHRLAEVRRILATEGQKLDAAKVDFNGRVITSTDDTEGPDAA